MTAVAIQYREQIIEQVAKGERLTDIARALGYATHAGISRQLANDPEYRQARETGAECRLDQREREMEQSDESVTVARARELLSQARWRCEREFPERWGTKGTTINIQVNVGQADQQLAASIADLIPALQQGEPEAEKGD